MTMYVYDSTTNYLWRHRGDHFVWITNAAS